LAGALSILSLLKYQFFWCTLIAVTATVIASAIRSKLSLKRIVIILTILFVPSVVFNLPQLWIFWHCRLPILEQHWFPEYTIFEKSLKSGGLALLVHSIKALWDEYECLYCVQGSAFSGFWGKFGWNTTNILLIIGSRQINDGLRLLIALISNLVLLLTLASLVKTARSFRNLVNRSRFKDAVYFACSNPVINNYLLLVAFFFLFKILVYPYFYEQGRNWFPAMVPIFLCVVCFTPRIFRSRFLRQTFSFSIIIGWLLYSIVGSYYAIRCVHQRYYEPDKLQPIQIENLKAANANAECRIETCDFLDPVTTFERHRNTLMIPKGYYMRIIGWAVDPVDDAPASAVLIYIDKSKIYSTRCGLASWQAESILHKKKYELSGFDTLLSTKGLNSGWHSLTMKVVSQNGRFLYNSDVNLRFIILDK